MTPASPGDVVFALAELTARVHNAAEFDGVLRHLVANDPGLQAVHYLVEETDGFGASTFGASADDEATSTETKLVGNRLVKLAVWRDVSSAVSVGNPDLWAVFQAYWRTDERSAKAGILSGHYGTLLDALGASVGVWAGGHVAVAFADLDHFKQFNDVNGYGAGDKLIRAVGQALASAAPPTCVVVHLSGDEFLVVATGATAHEALGVCVAVRASAEAAIVDAEQQLGGTRQSGLTMGLASYAPGTSDVSNLVEALRDRAEKAMKPGGAKRYGTVTVSPVGAAPPVGAADPDGLAVVLAAARLPLPVPFGNSWLNVLADLAHATASGDLSGLQSAVDALPLSPEAGESREALRASRDTLNGTTPLTPLEIALAVACGVARAALDGRAGPLSLDVRWTANGADLVLDDTSVLAVGDILQMPRSARLLTEGHAQAEPIASARALLVVVGAGDDQLPVELFAGVVHVDDRPTVGGGLPDLWEAALAQVVDAASANPNVGRVFLVGNLEHASHTVRMLENIDGWDADALAYKLGATTGRIRDVMGRLVGGARRVTTLDEVVGELLAYQEAAPALAAVVADPRARTVPRALRNSSVPDTYRLQAWDGCRVRSAYHAFPVALHSLRHSNAPVLRDQNRRAYLELSDFRIFLEDPAADPVPAFYLSEKANLAAYYQAQFASPEGLFRRVLDEDGQLAAVVEHVADAVVQGTSTRRAVLVVPHRLPESGSLSPLGLVSVRLVPRERDGGPVIDASFTWRTVEALVGLPYSLYGSIMFAQELTSRVAERLPDATARTVRSGTLSFTAQSLHVFTDEYAQRIARQIIAEETE